MKRELLERALEHVHQWGWTTQAIASAAKDMGLSPSSHGLFPRGAIELVEFFHEKCHAEWEAELAAVDKQNLTARERLAKALTLRLLKLAPYMTTWPQALALQAIPTAAPDALAQLARTCDVAWRFADDPGAEVHFEWYSKRVAVGGIYVAAEVYMLTDYSEGFEDTADFLARKLEDAQAAGAAAGGALAQAEQLMAQALQALQGHKDRNRP